jgi:hypothetical protein
MGGYDFSLLIGSLLGGLVIFPFAAAVLRYAVLGHEGSKRQKIYFIFIIALLAVGMAGFGEGADGFVSRTLNAPDLANVIGYGLAALVVSGFVSTRQEASPEGRTTVGPVARFFALLFVLPISAIGSINLIGGGYTALTYDEAAQNRSYVREQLLGGRMVEIWRLIEERSPADFQDIVEELALALEEGKTGEEVFALMNVKLADLRAVLSEYSDFLTDDERKQIIRTSLDMLKRVQEDPAICANVAETGGTNLPPKILEAIEREKLASHVAIFGGLLNARYRANSGNSAHTAWNIAPTSANYAALGEEIDRLGVNHEAVKAALSGDTSHPGYCEGHIGFSEGLLKLGGQAGQAVRWETTKHMLPSVTQ